MFSLWYPLRIQTVSSHRAIAQWSAMPWAFAVVPFAKFWFKLMYIFFIEMPLTRQQLLCPFMREGLGHTSDLENSPERFPYRLFCTEFDKVLSINIGGKSKVQIIAINMLFLCPVFKSSFFHGLLHVITVWV